MSSFSNPQHLYIFELRNGRRKLAYGESPADALEILRTRLTEEEMAEILVDRCTRIRQRELLQYVDDLG